MGATRVYGAAIAVLLGTVLVASGSRASAPECGPGVTSAVCASGGAAIRPGSATLVASADVASNAAFLPGQSARVPAFRSGGSPAGPSEQSNGEPVSLMVLGTVLVVAAWTLRHAAKAG